MDIKARIDALTEQDAKAALEMLIHYAGGTAKCNSCIVSSMCKEAHCEDTTCKNLFLDWVLNEPNALKEARE